MPAWLQVIADWNPFSAVAAACRQLFGNPNPSALVHAWPMQHPGLAVLLWSGVLRLRRGGLGPVGSGDCIVHIFVPTGSGTF